MHESVFQVEMLLAHRQELLVRSEPQAVSGNHANQHFGAKASHQKTDSGAGGRQQQTLHENQPHHVKPRSAERAPHRNLFLSLTRTDD
jgi:hypothetical protein